MDCVVYRCGKQAEMYLYVRAGFALEDLPPVLAKRVGVLSEVMSLTLSKERKLARVDVKSVMQALTEQGFYLQMPPDGRIHARLYSGD
ncbi:MAG: YcgL domain-containing protein [Nevskiales bacterium]